MAIMSGNVESDFDILTSFIDQWLYYFGYIFFFTLFISFQSQALAAGLKMKLIFLQLFSQTFDVRTEGVTSC